MPTPWRREPVYMPRSSPSPFQKPATSMFERLGLKAPPKKILGGPSASDPLGFLGEKGYAKDWQLREFARKKAEYKYRVPSPGVYRKLAKKQREELMKELMLRGREEAKKSGRQTYGMSEDLFKKVLKKVEGSSSILGGPLSEIGRLRSKGQLNKAKELQIKTQIWKKWARGKYK